MDIASVDLILVVLVIAGALWGLSAGAIRVVVPFTAALAAITLVHVYPDVSARFGTTPRIQFFLLLLLLAFVGLLIFGIVIRALQGVVQAGGLGPINRLVGLALGLVSGAMMAGALVWWIQTYSGPQAKSLLNGSALAPPLLEFFNSIMALTGHFVPRAKPAEPWWKRSLW
jgi:uncharacterized membrane protein required for colicin V production